MPKPAKTLFLFRHGETDWNRLQKFQGHSDIPLNELGRQQAKRLATFFAGVRLDLIFSSDLMRAANTAKILAKELESLGHDPIPVFETPALREANLGQAEGLTPEEIDARFGSGLIHKWKSNAAEDLQTAYPEGETGQAVIHRIRTTLEDACQNFDFKTAGVSTHGGVLRRFLASLNLDTHEKVPIPNGVIYGVEFRFEKLASSTGYWRLLETLPLSRTSRTGPKVRR